MLNPKNTKNNIVIPQPIANDTATIYAAVLFQELRVSSVSAAPFRFTRLGEVATGNFLFGGCRR
jgi:hypothetical protein